MIGYNNYLGTESNRRNDDDMRYFRRLRRSSLNSPQNQHQSAGLCQRYCFIVCMPSSGAVATRNCASKRTVMSMNTAISTMSGETHDVPLTAITVMRQLFSLQLHRTRSSCRFLVILDDNRNLRLARWCFARHRHHRLRRILLTIHHIAPEVALRCMQFLI